MIIEDESMFFTHIWLQAILSFLVAGVSKLSLAILLEVMDHAAQMEGAAVMEHGDDGSCRSDGSFLVIEDGSGREVDQVMNWRREALRNWRRVALRKMIGNHWSHIGMLLRQAKKSAVKKSAVRE